MIISLFSGAGLRLNELRNVQLCDIDSKAFQIKVVAGKGRKDRFTILPKQLLADLRKYYLQYKPSVYLFEGQTKGKPLHERSIQHFIQLYVKKMGWAGKIILPTRSVILLLHTCWIVAQIFIRSKNCWVIAILIQQWFTCTCNNPNGLHWYRLLTWLAQAYVDRR